MVAESVEILLVEDDDDDAELAVMALEQNRLANRIVRVKDGAQALEWLFENDPGGSAGRIPRLIMLDLKLPKVGGLTVLERIKADPRLRMVPVVVMTSSNDDRDIERSYALGVNSYITKPVIFESFVESVRKLGFYWLLMNRNPFGENGGVNEPGR